MEMINSNKRFKLKRQVVAIMILGIPLIGSFQNCGPSKMDFDVDQPALVIDAPVATRPSEPSNDNAPAGGGTTNASGGDGSGGSVISGGDGGSGGISGGSEGSSGTSDSVPVATAPGQSASDSPSINSDVPSDSSPSLDSPAGEPISEIAANDEADKSDEIDLNSSDTPPLASSDEDKRANESMSYICRVGIPNSKRVSTVKFRDGAFNSNSTNHKNRPYVVCMSKFSCEELIAEKLDVKEAVKRKFCDKDSNKRVIHMTREDIAGFLK
jgi:hypothetical protein